MNKKQIKRSWLIVSVLALGLCSATVENDKGFKIQISEDDKTTKLTCEHGCAWKTLSFAKPSQNNVAVVDQFGKGSLDEVSTEEGSSLAAFSFTMVKEGDKYTLESLEGTAWKSLSFNVKPYAAPRILDASGVVVP